MNERIRELKHQASVWCDENIPEQFSEETNGYGSAWEEKFAKLSVRECAVIADEPTSQPFSSYGEKIKQHFGVKE